MTRHQDPSEASRFTGALKWLGAAGGALVPGLSMFTSFVPPLFRASGIVASLLGAAILMAVYSHTPTSSPNVLGTPPLVTRAQKLISLGVALLLTYFICLNLWTVLDPREHKERYQIGFGTSEWGLTMIGLQWKEDRPEGPPEIWMRGEGAFNPEGPRKLWQPKAIHLAGTLLVLLFFGSFVAWTLGFGLLAKNESLSRRSLGA